ncbi:putative glycosyltransferase [Artemisia annua]|uniref:Putative glycosyltransferase n=1 Tax=Artemisia annua TaxID=35608 RepID=A0A2U1LES0_ARTAN|nr:putative glycosyltransferase [Artemisia annua]
MSTFKVPLFMMILVTTSFQIIISTNSTIFHHTSNISSSPINRNRFLSSFSNKKQTNLQKIERGLARARVAIKKARKSHLTQEDPDYVPSGSVYWHANTFHSTKYIPQVRKSKYCICASGWEVASPRMVEALYMGCVPVLVKDDYAKPFSDVLNWDTFSVDIPTRRIPQLKDILMAIPQRKYIRLQRNGVRVRKHFVVNLPPKRWLIEDMSRNLTP